MKRGKLFAGFFLINALLTGTCFAESAFIDYGKPLFTNRNSSDPSVRVFKWHNTNSGELYLYASCDFSGPGIYPMTNTYCYESTDEVNWIDHGVILTENDYPWVKKNALHLWAPDCYRGDNGKFYLYVPALDTNDVSRIGISIGDTPYGPFTPQSNYFQGIPGYANDPGICRDGKTGDKYMVYGTGAYPKGRLAILKMKADMLQADGAPKMLVIKDAPNEYMEGPMIEQFPNGRYYLFFAIYDDGGEAEAYAVAKKITGPYTYKGHIMERNIGEWTIQACVVKWGNHWSYYYHDIPDPKMKRMVCAEYLKMKPDGSLLPVRRTAEGLTN